MVCSRLCILRNRLSQNRIVCEWLNMTISMLLSVIELSFVIQDEPRVYHENSAVVYVYVIFIFGIFLTLCAIE